MSEPFYSIKDWGTVYENAQSRKCDRLHWVPVPNKHDGLSYRRIANMEDGTDIFTAWILILQVASRQPVRGVLKTVSGRPIDAEDMSFMTGFSEKIFLRAFNVLSDNRIGWLLVDPHGDGADQYCDTISPDLNGSEQNRTEQNETGRKKRECALPENFVLFWDDYPRKESKKKALHAWLNPANECEQNFQSIMDALQNHIASEQWSVAGIVCHPSTWLNQARWETPMKPAVEVSDGSEFLREDD